MLYKAYKNKKRIEGPLLKTPLNLTINNKIKDTETIIIKSTK